MKYDVICVARSAGSGGEEIARAVATRLGFQYVDQEIIARSAEKAGVAQEVVAKAEQKQPFLVRLLDALGRSAMTVDAGAQVALPPDVASVDSGPDRYEALIQETIRETAAAKQVVIVGHGASIPLAGTAGLLRLFVTGSPEIRVKRVMEASGKGEEEAWKEMEESDNQRRDYLRRFYDVPDESPGLYDVVINTDQFSMEQAVELIVRAAQG